LRIAADGSVAEAVVEAEDPSLTAHPILQSETQQLVRKWIFECQSCAPGVAFEHVIKFNYRLEGEDAPYDDTRVTLDLPDEVTIVARPPVCDRCPTPKKKTRQLAKPGVAVEKLLLAKFAKITLRQEAPQSIVSDRLDIFYPPDFGCLRRKVSFSTATGDSNK
jgi:hypothetical protein